VVVRFDVKDPPRRYQTGAGRDITISDCGALHLTPDEQVTFVTDSGGELDVARKSWGFYATPSLNSRLTSFGLHAALVRNRQRRYYVMLVERGREDDFAGYCAREALAVVTWLDTQADLDAIPPRPR
jgi:hypothetical protein